MKGAVEAGPGQVVHGRVHDHEPLLLLAAGVDLGVLDLGHQDTGIAGNDPAGLQDQGVIGIAQFLPDRLRILVRVRGLLVVVGDAQAAAQVQVPDGDTPVGQPGDEVLYLAQGLDKGLDLGELGADVAAHAQDLDILHVPGPLILVQGRVHRDAELVLGQAGGDVGVGPGIHVRVDAQGHRRPGCHAGGHLLQPVQFLGRFHVEHQDIGQQGLAHLGHGLAHAGIDDLPGVDPCLERPEQLAAGDDVGAAAVTGKQVENSDVGTGLDRKTGQVRCSVEGGIKGREVTLQGGHAVDIQWRSHGIDHLAHRHVLAVQQVVLVVKVMHCLPESAAHAPGHGAWLVVIV